LAFDRSTKRAILDHQGGPKVEMTRRATTALAKFLVSGYPNLSGLPRLLRVVMR